jgi:arylsulfatase A-like enzyme
MRNAHVDREPQRRTVLLAGLVLAAAVVAVGAGVAVGFAHLPAGVTQAAAGVVVAANVALLWPIIAFVLRDFRFSSARGLRRGKNHASSEPESPARLTTHGGDPSATCGERPPVILISIDTLRADRLGAYGSRRNLTPNLDRLAARGVVCDTAIASSSWTLPSVASFLTGLNPSRHGAGPSLNGFDLMARAPLRRGTWTLAQGLKAAGYQTHAIVSNPYLAVQYGLDAGFDSYENVSIESEAMVALRPTVAGRLLAPLLRAHVGDGGPIVTQRALNLLDRLSSAPAEQRPPFFLWLHYIDPHAPYGCGGNKSFRGDTLLSGIRHDAPRLDVRFEAIARLRSGEIRLSLSEKDQLIALYDAGVAEVDRQIGAVVDRVRGSRSRKSGKQVTTNTRTIDDPLLIVVADHGEEFWDHGGVEHGHTLYEELVRVPLIFSGGGLPTSERLSNLVRLIDLPQTILAILGLSGPDSIDGKSFASTLARLHSGSPPDARAALCEALLFAEEKVAIRTDHYKYIQWANGKEELYDLLHDPAELRDVAASTDLTWGRRMLAEHAAARLQSGGLPEPEREWPAADRAALRARLEGLGYV